MGFSRSCMSPLSFKCRTLLLSNDTLVPEPDAAATIIKTINVTPNMISEIQNPAIEPNIAVKNFFIISFYLF